MAVVLLKMTSGFPTVRWLQRFFETRCSNELMYFGLVWARQRQVGNVVAGLA